jgi:hypothetical protein
MRTAWILLLLLASAPTALGALAAPAAERKVTLHCQGTPLRDALDLFVQHCGAQYEMGPDVPNVKVSLSVWEEGFESTLCFVVAVAAEQAPGLRVVRKDRKYVIGFDSKEPLQVGPKPTRVVDGKVIAEGELQGRRRRFLFVNTPLRTALRIVAQTCARDPEDADLGYAVDAGVPDDPVSASISAEGVYLLLTRIVHSTGKLECNKREDLLLIRKPEPVPDMKPQVVIRSWLNAIIRQELPIRRRNIS